MSEPTSAFEVREFKIEDLEKVIYINRTCLPENYPAFFFVDHFRNYPKAFLVAEMGGEVVGYIMCRVEWAPSFFTKRIVKKGHIISIAVLPHARKKGIGKTLMIRAMQALKNCYGVDEYFLEVRVSNLPAIMLYEKLGFKIVKILRHYYHDGEDAYLMAREA